MGQKVLNGELPSSFILATLPGPTAWTYVLLELFVSIFFRLLPLNIYTKNEKLNSKQGVQATCNRTGCYSALPGVCT